MAQLLVNQLSDKETKLLHRILGRALAHARHEHHQFTELFLITGELVVDPQDSVLKVLKYLKERDYEVSITIGVITNPGASSVEPPVFRNWNGGRPENGGLCLKIYLDWGVKSNTKTAVQAASAQG